MSSTKPFKLLDWIDDNREHLKPPVCNKQMFEHGDFIVQVVGGPNSRTDYHLDEGPELFYQVEGEMLLKTVQDGEFVDIPIGEGEIFLLPRARAALAAALQGHRRHRRRAQALRRTSSTASCGSARAARTSCTRSTCTWRTSSKTCRRCSSGSTQRRRAHLQALRHGHAAEVSRGHAEFDRGARGRTRARRGGRACAPCAREFALPQETTAVR